MSKSIIVLCVPLLRSKLPSKVPLGLLNLDRPHQEERVDVISMRPPLYATVMSFRDRGVLLAQVAEAIHALWLCLAAGVGTVVLVSRQRKK